MLHYNITGVHVVERLEGRLSDRPNPSCPAKAGHPVRRGLSVLSLTSLEYGVTRLRG